MPKIIGGINSLGARSLDSREAKIKEENCQIINDVQAEIGSDRFEFVSLTDFEDEELKCLSKQIGDEARFISLEDVENLSAGGERFMVNKKPRVARIILSKLKESCKIFIIPKEVMVLIGESLLYWISTQIELKNIIIMSNMQIEELISDSYFSSISSYVKDQNGKILRIK